MERGAVVQDLDIAGAEFHLEPELGPGRQLAEIVDGFLLERIQTTVRFLGAMLDLTLVVAAG